MKKFRYVCLAVATYAVATLSFCVGNTPKAENSSPSTTANTASQNQTVTNSSHSIKQININGLLDAANAEYGAAIANGKIAEAVEYQDSRSFIIYTQNLYKQIDAQMAKDYPEPHKVIENSMTKIGSREQGVGSRGRGKIHYSRMVC